MELSGKVNFHNYRVFINHSITANKNYSFYTKMMKIKND